MDAKLLENDLVKAFQAVPKAFVQDVATVLMAHDLRDIWPKVEPFVMKNIKVLAMEAMTGMLDGAEVEQAIRGAAAKVGISLPEPSKAA